LLDSLPNLIGKKQEPIDEMGPFWVVDTWRNSLLEFIEQDTGHASRDTQWMMNFFEFSQ
jgi:hypothetical protein